MKEETWRKPASRAFALLALVAMLVWGGRLFQSSYPIEATIRYLYKEVPRAADLLRVSVSVLDAKRQVVSRVSYFHHGGLRGEKSSMFREQRLRLLRGSYTLLVRLHYKRGHVQRLSQVLLWEASGGHHLVRLAQAKGSSVSDRL